METMEVFNLKKERHKQMSWELFSVDSYSVFSVSQNTQGFPDIYGFITLDWEGTRTATLWFYRESAVIPANASFNSGGHPNYYGRFGQAQFSDCVDLLRNEKPVFFHWNETTKGVFLATGEEPVGEAEQP
jgi:hypothetical protein